MRSRTWIIFIFLFNMLSACGSIAPQPKSTPVDTAERLVIKRHAQSLVQASAAGDRGKMEADMTVLNTLLRAQTAQLPQILPAYVPEVSQARWTQILAAPPVETKTPPVKKDASAAAKAVATNPNDAVLGEIQNLLREFGERESVDVPSAFRRKVDYWIGVYSSNAYRRWFEQTLRRRAAYENLIQRSLQDRHLPTVLSYLAFIESGFDPHARSASGAVGLWQLTGATAQRYGLTVNKRVDERTDAKLATRAAREYLHDLVLEFGDGQSMLLAIAAYDAGENTIRAQLRKLQDYRSRSYWTLDEKNLLPKQTGEYVPKMIAAAVLTRRAQQ